MKIEILFFGITADLVKVPVISLEISKDLSVDNLKLLLLQKYPQLKKINSYAVAVNEIYAVDNLVLKENDIVAVIPPVSGG